jgi:hypothetical protein
MTFDFSKWMGKYGDVAPDESIEYKDSSGTWNEETDYSLSSISSQFQQRGYIFRDELRKIGNGRQEVGLTTISRRTASLQ